MRRVPGRRSLVRSLLGLTAVGVGLLLGPGVLDAAAWAWADTLLGPFRLVIPAESDPAPPRPCPQALADQATVSVALVLGQNGLGVDVTSTSTVTFPLATHNGVVGVDPTSVEYHNALRCLFGAVRPWEDRPVPAVALTGGLVTVTETVRATSLAAGEALVGYWKISGTDRTVTAELRPSVMHGARWSQVEVRGDQGLLLRAGQPTDSSASDRLVWTTATAARGSPEVAVAYGLTSRPQVVGPVLNGFWASGISLVLPYSLLLGVVMRLWRLPAARRQVLAVLICVGVAAFPGVVSLPAALLLAGGLRSGLAAPWALAVAILTGWAWTAAVYGLVRLSLPPGSTRQPRVRARLRWAVGVGVTLSLVLPAALVRAPGTAGGWQWATPLEGVPGSEPWRELVWYSDSLAFSIGWRVAWLVTALAVVQLLRVMGTADRAPDVRARLLLAFLATVALQPAEDVLLGALFPLAAMTTLGVLVTIFLRRRTRSIPARIAVLNRAVDPGWSPPPRSMVLAAGLRFRVAEERALRVERAADDDTDLSTPNGQRTSQLAERRRELRHEIALTRQDCGLDHPDLAAISPLEVALNEGPRDSWWENGCRAGLVALGIGTPAAAVLYVIDLRSRWPAPIESYGPLLALLSLCETLLMFGLTGFVLGCLWRDLPWTRGISKPVMIVLGYLCGGAAVALAHRALHEEADLRFLANAALLFVVLSVTGAWLDVEILHDPDRAWTGRVRPMVALYSLRSAWTVAVAVLANIAAVLAVWQGVQDGLGAGRSTSDSRVERPDR